MTLRSRIESLSPENLELFKTQARAKAQAGDPSYSQLVSSQEYADIFGADLQPSQPQQKQWWQTPLEVIGAPFSFVQENVIDPALAMLLSGATPSTQGTEDMGWFERERAEFNAWQTPGINLPWISPFSGEQARVDIKGVIQNLPWLAIPGVGSVGKGTGFAGKIGKLGSIGRVAGTALEFSPWGLTEKGLGQVGKLAGKAAAPLTGRAAANVAKIEDPVMKKLVEAIRAVKPKRAQYNVEKSAELAKRTATAESILEGKTGYEAFQSAKGALAGKYDIPDFEAVFKQFTEEEVGGIFDRINTSPARLFDRLDAADALMDFGTGMRIPTKREVDLVSKVLGKEIGDALRTHRPRSEQALRALLDATGLPKAILSSYDMSAPLRQGAVLVAAHPKSGLKNIGNMIKAFASEKTAVKMEDQLLKRAIYPRAAEAKLYIAPYKQLVGKLAEREEAFMSGLAEKIPGVAMSERAYITFLNKMRMDTFEYYINNWAKNGVKATAEDEKQLARMINILSGRGDLGALSEMRTVLNAGFFSPGFVASRAQTPMLLFTGNPLIRKTAAREIASFVGAGLGILSLASLAGGEVETDPRSTDFGKIKIGNTRLDFWGGFQPYARFVSQLISGERKSATGNIYPIEREDLITRFIRSKESPLAGLLNDIIVGETFIGEELSTTRESILQQARNRLVPMFAQDIWDAVDEQGLFGGFLALPGVLGATVTSYGSEEKDIRQLRDKVAQETYGMDWNSLGMEMGSAAQRTLEQQYPDLQKNWITSEDTLLGRGDAWREYRRKSTHIKEFTQDELLLASAKMKADGNGTEFREKVNEIMSNQRAMYKEMKLDPQFKDIEDTLVGDLTPAELSKMNPLDVARMAYNEMMYAPDLYDQYGEYQFDLAAQRKEQFVRQYGQAALDYVEDFMGLKWQDTPELQDLAMARDALKPYWKAESDVWAQYPPMVKQESDRIAILEQQNPIEGKRALFRSQFGKLIMMARKMVAIEKKRTKMKNPEIAMYLKKYYSY